MSIRENIERVREEISEACIRSGRRPEDILLLAVTKYVDTDRILQALETGITDVGENHAQEVREKLTFYKQHETKVHFIGHLQSNKLKYLIGETSLIQSVDSLSLVDEIEKKSVQRDCIQNILVQVNIGNEPQKSGVDVKDLNALMDRIGKCAHISVRGLMCVPPNLEPEEVRRDFAGMRELFEKTKSAYPEFRLTELSMGMSHDFPQAVEEGATIVRVGSAIFGARDRM